MCTQPETQAKANQRTCKWKPSGKVYAWKNTEFKLVSEKNGILNPVLKVSF
jgi:hypothetical protein